MTREDAQALADRIRAEAEDYRCVEVSLFHGSGDHDWCVKIDKDGEDQIVSWIDSWENWQHVLRYHENV